MDQTPDIIPVHSKKIEKDYEHTYKDNVILLKQTNHIRAIQTILRNEDTQRSDFIFYADRLIRLVVEEGLNILPYSKMEIITPSGDQYCGLAFEKNNCGVSVIRSGEAMEKGLRDCCRSMRIGKILIQTDEDSDKARVYYAKFPPEIEKRKVLLMYPIMSYGRTVMKAIDVLREHGVPIRNVTLLTLFSTPESLDFVFHKYSELRVVTSCIDPHVLMNFGQKYFGTN